MSRRPFGSATVWSRLLSLLGFVVAPIAVVTLILAYSIYNDAVENVRRTQATSAVGRAGAVRSWLDSAGRLVANQNFAASFLDADDCALLAKAFITRNEGFAAVRFLDRNDAPCQSGDPALPPGSPALNPAQGDPQGYAFDAEGSKLMIVSHAARSKAPDAPPTILVVDAAALREHLPVLSAIGQAHVALLDRDGRPIAFDVDGADGRWLPAQRPPGLASGAWRGMDQAGQGATFFLAPVDGPNLAVLIRFDDRQLAAARQRFFILFVAQLAMLGLLALVYATTIRRDVVFWIRGLQLAAQEHGADPKSLARAPIAPNMPLELQSVAVSFNDMVDRAHQHQREITASLGENRVLMLEMHHRIKNSLQVIQSYLALIRRTTPKVEAKSYSRIEARVGVLAVAYRLALTPNGIRPIHVRAFLEEVCHATIGGLRRPRQRTVVRIDWDGELIVDRAIALGLGLVEGLIAAFDSLEAEFVGVTLTANDDGRISLRIECDGEVSRLEMPQKILNGLANQLGATPMTASPDLVLGWVFTP